MQSVRRPVFAPWPCVAALLVSAGTAAAQPPPAPVGATEVLLQAVRGTVTLPGTVASRQASVVASEAEGLVVSIEVDAGDRVRVKQPLAGLRRISLELMLREEQGRLKEAQARLDLAESKLARAKRLFGDEVISQDELDDADSEFVAWQGRVDQSTAAIDQLKVALDRTTIRAPFSGVVVRKTAELGEWIPLGGPVVEMVSLDEIEVWVDVPERYFAAIRVGTEAEVVFEALERFAVTGTVDGVIPQADRQARTFPIRVVIPNPESRIAPGMLAQVVLPAGRTEEATLVPKDAIVRQGPTEMVFRITDDATVEPVPVEAGRGFGAWIQVDGPLGAGDRVVTRGNERLRPGQSVVPTAQEYAAP